jgi:hypothetical protein
MRSLAIYSASKTQDKQKTAYDVHVPSLFEIMMPIPFVYLASSFTLRYLSKSVAYDSRPRLKKMTGFTFITLYSMLITAALAATDCEILNSGIPSISSMACCTDTAGIVCLNGRVKEM